MEITVWFGEKMWLPRFIFMWLIYVGQVDHCTGLCNICYVVTIRGLATCLQAINIMWFFYCAWVGCDQIRKAIETVPLEAFKIWVGEQ